MFVACCLSDNHRGYRFRCWEWYVIWWGREGTGGREGTQLRWMN